MANRGRDIQQQRRTTRGSSYDEAPRVSSRGRVRSAKGPGPEGGTDLVFKLFLIALAVVALRLVWLQVITAPQLASEAEVMRTRRVEIFAKRGTIYDRNGNVLAMSVECQTIYCNPNEVENAEAVADALVRHLGGNKGDYLDILEQDTTFAYVKRKVDNTVADALAEDLAEQGVVGVYYLPDTKRVYPYGAVLGQVLGVVGLEGEGLTGLELQYNDILSGTNGELAMELGRDGTPIAGGASTVTPAQDGQDIVISIDINVQITAERVIQESVEQYGAESGVVVVTDPRSGEIIALCSTPFANLENPSSIVDEALVMKPVSYSYEPGSIFKVLTLAIGIEKGVFTPDTSFAVPPEVQVGDDWVRDDDLRSYSMDMDVREIMRRSSNTGAIIMSRQIGLEDFEAGVRAFGIGSLTGIDFPGEVPGIVTPHDEFTSTTLGVMSFGQGVAVPMIQMVRAVGVVANGGYLTTPHLLISVGGEPVEWERGERVIKKKTAETVTDVLMTVVQEGTGMGAAVAGFDVAGKTGTGEMVDLEHGGYMVGRYLASMIGYANANDAQVLVYVGLNGTPLLAAESAAHVFSTIMSDALSNMGVQPVA